MERIAEWQSRALWRYGLMLFARSRGYCSDTGHIPPSTTVYDFFRSEGLSRRTQPECLLLPSKRTQFTVR